MSYNTVSYEYDTRGNILSKVYSLNGETVDTVTYSYGNTVWKDQLTNYNGTAIFYDGIGNPTNWVNGETLSWQHGRQLASYTKDGKTISYTYNSDGIRTSKTEKVNDIETTTTYNVVDGILRSLTQGNHTLRFFDNQILYNDTSYWFVTNAQNDIIGLIDANGDYVVQYTYDSWGKLLSMTCPDPDDITLATLNPFRYRGYIYDDETGFYYCQSRYYDPAVGRWLNADRYLTTGDTSIQHNMYAYCLNNPIVYVDPTGEFWWVIPLIFIPLVFAGCDSPRTDLANSPDLNVNKAPSKTYNCYGNGIGKQIIAEPTGYETGDSTRETFSAVKNDLGESNVRELESIDSPIGQDEFKVAMKCGPYDYHFIREENGRWYNKSGDKDGLYIEKALITNEYWHPIYIENGKIITIADFIYDDETIYFAVKIGWDKQ